MSYVDLTPLGSCQIYNNVNGQGNPPTSVLGA
jgi:hypothetical protein